MMAAEETHYADFLIPLSLALMLHIFSHPEGEGKLAGGETTGSRLKNEMRPEGGDGKRTVSAANFVADFAPDQIPGALPPASGRWPSGPFSIDPKLDKSASSA